MLRIYYLKIDYPVESSLVYVHFMALKILFLNFLELFRLNKKIR